MLGLVHANEHGIAYGDATDYMASGQRASNWPLKCFNGLKNWQLGWYESRQLTLEKTFEKGYFLKLATFVDFDRTAPDEYVVINIADELYLQYNLAKGFNKDTEEKQNEVTITAPGDTGSEGLDGLKEKESHKVSNFKNSGRDLVVESCGRKTGILGADMMMISVAYDISLCKQIEEHTSTPSSHPTDQPTTKSPSTFPSMQPSKFYSGSPSTNSPSPFPSMQPSKVYSESPTVVSGNPSSAPSATPSKLETLKPLGPPILPKIHPPHRPPSIAPTSEPRIDYFTLIQNRQKQVMGKPVTEIDELKSLFDQEDP